MVSKNNAKTFKGLKDIKIQKKPEIKKEESKIIEQRPVEKRSTIDNALENIIKNSSTMTKPMKIEADPSLKMNPIIAETPLEQDLANVPTTNTINNNQNISYAINDNYGSKSQSSYDIAGYPKEVSGQNVSLQNQFRTSSMQEQEKGLLNRSGMINSTTGYPEERSYSGSEPEKKKRNDLW